MHVKEKNEKKKTDLAKFPYNTEQRKHTQTKI